eukprot:8479210-Prorocentrum_lima.AAC.1
MCANGSTLLHSFSNTSKDRHSGNPTAPVLDLGCTRSMASLNAMLTSEQAAVAHGVWLEWKPRYTVMSFATSKKGLA